MSNFRSAFYAGLKAGSRTPKQDAALAEKAERSRIKKAFARQKKKEEREKLTLRRDIEREKTKQAEIKLFRGR